MNVVNFKTKQQVSVSEKLDWVDAMMADHGLDATATRVGHCLARILNRESGKAFVSDSTISDMTGISVRRVIVARNDLRAAGWITWSRTRTANVYSLLDGAMAAVVERQKTLKGSRDAKRKAARDMHARAEPNHADYAEPNPPVLHACADIPGSSYPVENPGSKKVSHDLAVVDMEPAVNQLVEPTVNQLAESTSEFENWWQQYPKRVGKLKAEQAYSAAKKKATADELLEGASRYAAERAGQDPKYTKHPTTWLNAGGWLDEPQQPSRPTGLAVIKAGLESFYYDEVRK
jgi:hypothetical protein